MQTKMIIAMVLAWAGPWIAKHGLSPDVLGTFLNAFADFALTYGVPFASAVYAAWQSRHKAVVAAVQSSPTEQVITTNPDVQKAVPATTLVRTLPTGG